MGLEQLGEWCCLCGSECGVFAAPGFRWVVLGSLIFLSHLGETGGLIDENIEAEVTGKGIVCLFPKNCRSFDRRADREGVT